MQYRGIHFDTHLASESRELQYVECLIEYWSIVWDINKHADLPLSHPLPFPNKVILEEASEFALPEGHKTLLITPSHVK